MQYTLEAGRWLETQLDMSTAGYTQADWDNQLSRKCNSGGRLHSCWSPGKWLGWQCTIDAGVPQKLSPRHGKPVKGKECSSRIIRESSSDTNLHGAKERVGRGKECSVIF